MRCLSNRHVEGMVPYHAAFEIPAFVVMDLIVGPDLHKAVESRACEEWDTILKITVELAAVIRKAHLLPERVLHRDIRPSNVMLKDYYTDPDAWEVAVCDFDLSWHKDALEQSVLQSASGYLAPEQLFRHS